MGKNNKIRFLTHPNDVHELNAKDWICIAGDAVFISLASTGIMPPNADEYIEQTPRPTTSTLSFFTNKKEDTLRVWVLKSVLDACKSFKRPPILAIDHYLKYGFQQKIDTVLIVGTQTDYKSHIETLVFQKGKLIQTQERSLFGWSDRDFPGQLDLLSRDLAADYKGFELLVSAPLDLREHPISQVCRNIGDVAFQRRVSTQLVFGETIVDTQRYLLPAGIALLALIGYGGIIANSWNSYSDALTDYRKASQGVENFDENMLRVLEAKNNFLSASAVSPQIGTVHHARQLAAAIASIENAHIKKLFVKNPNTNNEGIFPGMSADADFGVVLVLPAQANSTGIEQASPILNRLATVLGAQLRSIRQDISTDPTTTAQKQLKITFEGIWHG